MLTLADVSADNMVAVALYVVGLLAAWSYGAWRERRRQDRLMAIRNRVAEC